jgi:cytoskeletal protein RodZ
MKDPLQEIGLLIKSARQTLGMSLEDLAHESRVSSHHIANLESANREALPEDTFLFGFLSKILKALKLKEPAKIIEKFKRDEGEYVLQFLVEENFNEPQSQKIKRRFFRVYYLYVILFVIVLALGVLLINNVNKDNEKEFLSKQLITSSQTSTLVNNEIDSNQEAVVDEELVAQENASEATEILTSAEELNDEANVQSRVSEKDYVYKNTYSKGRGEKSLFLRVKEVAWVQVLGANSQNILFEGDVFPALEPNQFMFRDKEGFVLATGNAGAFEFDTGEGLKSLGESGQLIKWYYPKALKRKLIRANRKKSN